MKVCGACALSKPLMDFQCNLEDIVLLLCSGFMLIADHHGNAHMLIHFRAKQEVWIKLQRGTSYSNTPGRKLHIRDNWHFCFYRQNFKSDICIYAGRMQKVCV